MNVSDKLPLACLLFILFFHNHARAQVLLEAEGSLVFSGKNEIRIPGNTGTTFNANELSTPLRLAYRIRAGYRINDRHNVFILFAPLRLKYKGDFDVPVNFNGKNFGASNSTVDYVFNSYRLTYRYDFLTTDRLRIGAGVTGKIRNAYIQVSQDNESSRKKNAGFVPLINLMLSYQITENVGILLEGDGLASGKGRAFDFQLAVPIKLDDFVGVKLAYRVLEGGVNDNEVYNFSWINYISAGVFYNFY